MTAHRIIEGDVRKALAGLETDSVHCVVTSPPYWNLRDYGAEGQIGAEASPRYYVETMVRVMAGVRRVLRPDGTLWLNIGDSSHRGQLAGVPWRLALAMQEDGWFLQREIVWHKPNPMPGNATKGPSTSHETVFLFSGKSPYYYDGYAVREPGSSTDTRDLRSVWTIPVARYKGSHFATFPEELARRCILAGSSERGCCLTCRKPYKRLLKRERTATGRANRDPLRHVTAVSSLGFVPDCNCQRVVTTPIPCTILDPFAGAGTTNAVAAQLGRHSIGIEIHPQSAKLARERVAACQK